jgi:hypothetical protein
MLQANPVMKNTYSNIKTIGENLVSFLKQPFFTFTFTLPELKKPDPQEMAKPAVLKKAMTKNRYNGVRINTQSKPPTVPNGFSRNKVKSIVFTPSRNHEEYEKIQFVLRACERNSGKEFANVLHVENVRNGSKLIATDGKRMHVVEISTRIKQGNYKPIVTKDKIILGIPVLNVSFPNWERVVPTKVTRRGCVNIDNTAVYEYSRIYKSFTEMSGEKVNPNYLSDLTKKPWVVYCQSEKRKAILLKEHGAKRETYAVIMPLSA